MHTNQQPIRKAVIAAAGLGTRFLPQTKAMPKEMLPLVDKPVIQYIVEELVGAGIQQIIIVTGSNKRAIEDHFDEVSLELLQNLQKPGKEQILEDVKKISQLAEFIYVRQKGIYGNATPVMNCEAIIGDEPFIYAFADDYVLSTPSRFQQMIDSHKAIGGGSVFTAIQRSEPGDFGRYGYVSGKDLGDGMTAMDMIIEKPGSAEAAPSTLASVSSYIFDPAIFDYLRAEEKVLPSGIEFAIQPAVQAMINDGHKVYAKEIEGAIYYDTGNKLEYIKAVVDFALRHEEIGSAFKEYMNQKHRRANELTHTK